MNVKLLDYTPPSHGRPNLVGFDENLFGFERRPLCYEPVIREPGDHLRVKPKEILEKIKTHISDLPEARLPLA